jgi:hypothetical protein
MLIQGSGNQVVSSELKNGLFVRFYESYYGFLQTGAGLVPTSVGRAAIQHRDHGRNDPTPYSTVSTWGLYPSPSGTPIASLQERNPAQNIMILNPSVSTGQTTPYFGAVDQHQSMTRFFYSGTWGENTKLSYTDRTTTFDGFNSSATLYNINRGGQPNYVYWPNNPYTVGQQEATFPDSAVYSIMATGYLRVPSEAVGDWRVTFGADDDAYCWIGQAALDGNWRGDNVTVDAGGLHGDVYETRIVNFPTAGYYPIRLVFSENGGGDTCNFEFAGPGIGTRWDGTGFLYSKATATGF